MAKEKITFRLEPEVIRQIKELSTHLESKLGTRISQAQVVEMGVKCLAEREKK